jgi:hypothetical protein
VVLPVLAREDDGATSLNTGDRPITKLGSPLDLFVQLGKEILGANHMICVALESRTHRSWSLASEKPRSTKTLCSLMWTGRNVAEPSYAGARLKTELHAKSKLCSSSSPQAIWVWASSSFSFSCIHGPNGLFYHNMSRRRRGLLHQGIVH